MTQALIPALMNGLNRLNNDFDTSVAAQTQVNSELLTRKTMFTRIFTESDVWHCSAPDTPVFVLCIGGGGGAGYTDASSHHTDFGSAGGDSSFGMLCTAEGGQTGTNGSGIGNSSPYAPGFFSFGAGGGGSYSGAVSISGKAGKIATFFGTTSDDVVVTVGAGGTAGTSRVSPGTQGMVWVFWWGNA